MSDGQPDLTVVVPAYNEADTIAQVVERVQALPYRCQIIVVDDCSTDGTYDAATALGDGVEVLRHDRNQGKGAALRTGFANARGGVVVIQDADLEYDPVEIPSCMEPIFAGHADVVYGSRLSGGRPQRVHLFWHKAGNRVLSLLTDILYNTTLTDMETGYKAFTLEDLLAPSSRCASPTSASSPSSRPRSAGAGSASTSCPSPTTAGATTRARRSPGRTGSRRCGRCSSTASGISRRRVEARAPPGPPRPRRVGALRLAGAAQRVAPRRGPGAAARQLLVDHPGGRHPPGGRVDARRALALPLLPQERPAIVPTFWALNVGQLFNNILPARAGEVARVLALSHETGMSRTYGFVTVVVERVFDLVAIAILALLAWSSSRTTV